MSATDCLEDYGRCNEEPDTACGYCGKEDCAGCGKLLAIPDDDLLNTWRNWQWSSHPGETMTEWQERMRMEARNVR